MSVKNIHKNTILGIDMYRHATSAGDMTIYKTAASSVHEMSPDDFTLPGYVVRTGDGFVINVNQRTGNMSRAALYATRAEAEAMVSQIGGTIIPVNGYVVNGSRRLFQKGWVLYNAATGYFYNQPTASFSVRGSDGSTFFNEQSEEAARQHASLDENVHLIPAVYRTADSKPLLAALPEPPARTEPEYFWVIYNPEGGDYLENVDIEDHELDWNRDLEQARFFDGAGEAIEFILEGYPDLESAVPNIIGYHIMQVIRDADGSQETTGRYTTYARHTAGEGPLLRVETPPASPEPLERVTIMKVSGGEIYYWTIDQADEGHWLTDLQEATLYDDESDAQDMIDNEVGNAGNPQIINVQEDMDGVVTLVDPVVTGDVQHGWVIKRTLGGGLINYVHRDNVGSGYSFPQDLNDATFFITEEEANTFMLDNFSSVSRNQMEVVGATRDSENRLTLHNLSYRTLTGENVEESLSGPTNALIRDLVTRAAEGVAADIVIVDPDEGSTGLSDNLNDITLTRHGDDWYVLYSTNDKYRITEVNTNPFMVEVSPMLTREELDRLPPVSASIDFDDGDVELRERTEPATERWSIIGRTTDGDVTYYAGIENGSIISGTPEEAVVFEELNRAENILSQVQNINDPEWASSFTWSIVEAPSTEPESEESSTGFRIDGTGSTEVNSWLQDLSTGSAVRSISLHYLGGTKVYSSDIAAIFKWNNQWYFTAVTQDADTFRILQFGGTYNVNDGEYNLGRGELVRDEERGHYSGADVVITLGDPPALIRGETSTEPAGEEASTEPEFMNSQVRNIQELRRDNPNASVRVVFSSGRSVNLGDNSEMWYIAGDWYVYAVGGTGRAWLYLLSPGVSASLNGNIINIFTGNEDHYERLQHLEPDAVISLNLGTNAEIQIPEEEESSTEPSTIPLREINERFGENIAQAVGMLYHTGSGVVVRCPGLIPMVVEPLSFGITSEGILLNFRTNFMGQVGASPTGPGGMETGGEVQTSSTDMHLILNDSDMVSTDVHENIVSIRSDQRPSTGLSTAVPQLYDIAAQRDVTQQRGEQLPGIAKGLGHLVDAAKAQKPINIKIADQFVEVSPYDIIERGDGAYLIASTPKIFNGKMFMVRLQYDSDRNVTITREGFTDASRVGEFGLAGGKPWLRTGPFRSLRFDREVPANRLPAERGSKVRRDGSVWIVHRFEAPYFVVLQNGGNEAREFAAAVSPLVLTHDFPTGSYLVRTQPSRLPDINKDDIVVVVNDMPSGGEDITIRKFMELGDDRLYRLLTKPEHESSERSIYLHDDYAPVDKSMVARHAKEALDRAKRARELDKNALYLGDKAYKYGGFTTFGSTVYTILEDEGERKLIPSSYISAAKSHFKKFSALSSRALQKTAGMTKESAAVYYPIDDELEMKISKLSHEMTSEGWFTYAQCQDVKAECVRSGYTSITNLLHLAGIKGVIKRYLAADGLEKAASSK